MPVYDRDALLRRLVGDENLVEKIVDGFLADMPKQIQALKAFLSSGDAGASEHQAHTIKGAAANVGGDSMRAVALDVEKAAKAGDLTSAEAGTADLEAEFERLKEAMLSPCL